ncbi:MAG: GMC family oxidoreductase N-terminal domain-containing protein [Acidimicrobiales bacterium]
MTSLHTEVLVIGSGAGGATTAAVLAEAGKAVTVVEEGPWVEPDAVDPFSMDEMMAKYRHQGSSAALGSPTIAYAEGRCVGGSTEINSGLWHRLPDNLAAAWAAEADITEFTPSVLHRYAAMVEDWQSVSKLPGPPPISSAILARGADKLGWRSVEFPRVFRFNGDRSEKQTMLRTLLPRAVAAGATVLPNTRATAVTFDGRRATGIVGTRTVDGVDEPISISADHVVVCGGAIQTPALLQRSGIRRGVGVGLKFHPTVKLAARFEHALDHDSVPMHRVTEFAPNLTIGGSASRMGHVALALTDGGVDVGPALAQWENVGIYYAAIRSDVSGRVVSVPGLAAPVVTYRLTEGDLSRLCRGLIHLGELLLAAGAIELFPSIADAPVVRDLNGLHSWWRAFDRRRARLMTVHLTSSMRMGERPGSAAADSFGRVHGFSGLRVNDASLLPDAPGVNPQAAIMTIAARNADHLLAES